MSAEVLQQVAAMFNRFVHIKSGDGTCGTGGHIIRPCEYYCRAVVNFCQTGCYDADDTFVPFLIIKHDGTAFGQPFQIGHNIVSFFCHALVEVFPGFVVLIDLSRFLQCGRKVLLCEEVHRFLTVLDASRCVDTWSDFEHDIADGDLLFGESAYIDDGFHADAGVAVQLLQAVIGENTVFAHDRDDVRCNAHRYEVEQWNQMMKFNTIVDSKCLHKLKTNSATGKVGVWISVVQAFGIQDCDGRGEDIVRHMMVADDKVDSLFFRKRYFLHCFDSAVEYDD